MSHVYKLTANIIFASQLFLIRFFPHEQEDVFIYVRKLIKIILICFEIEASVKC